MGTRLFLALIGFLTAPYGVYCLIRPDFLAGYAGIMATTATGTIELRAMYGGLQTAFGLLAFFGALRPAYARTALISTAFLCAGLGSSRLAGVIAAGELSQYTVQALAFEFLATIISITLLRRQAQLLPSQIG